MSEKITLFYTQHGDSAHGEPAQFYGSTLLTPGDVSVRAIEERALNEQVEQSKSPYLAFSSSSIGIPGESLEQLYRGLNDNRHAHMVLLIPQQDETAQWIWSTFSVPLPLLIQPFNSAQAVLVRASAFQRFGMFRELDNRLHDWLIRASTTAPDEVIACQSPAEDNSSAGWLPDLAPAEPPPHRAWLHDHLVEFKPATAALTAGLLQLHDYLEESHSYSQSIQGDALGDHWHGIMHRREPDYSNAKYWYRRVGDSPIFAELAERAEAILQSCDDPEAESLRVQLGLPETWDAFGFIDACEAYERSPQSRISDALRRIQFWEMLLLLQSCNQAMSS